MTTIDNTDVKAPRGREPADSKPARPERAARQASTAKVEEPVVAEVKPRLSESEVDSFAENLGKRIQANPHTAIAAQADKLQESIAYELAG